MFNISGIKSLMPNAEKDITNNKDQRREDDEEECSKGVIPNTLFKEIFLANAMCMYASSRI